MFETKKNTIKGSQLELVFVFVWWAMVWHHNAVNNDCIGWQFIMSMECLKGKDVYNQS